jgi:hypothetical protein
MPTPSEIIDMAASLQNDTAQTLYTDDACLPYLNMALDELQEIFEQNNIPVTNVSSAILTVNASTLPGVTVIGYTTAPALPPNLTEIQQLWERLINSDPFVPMTKVEFLPHYLEQQLVSQLQFWAWIGNSIQILNSNQNNQLKLDYVTSIFATPLTMASINTDLGVQFKNIKTYLGYKTGALASMYVGANETRAAALNMQAEEALSRTLGISIKGRQSINTRRRPFRASYKRRSVW